MTASSHQRPRALPDSPKCPLPVNSIAPNWEENVIELGSGDEEQAEQLPKNIVFVVLEPEKPDYVEMSTDQLQGDSELLHRQLDLEEENTSKDRPLDILCQKMVQRGSWIKSRQAKNMTLSFCAMRPMQCVVTH
ncbi:uncharacterized protein LOC124161533 [Ischnura elegans]|uniref:uncharacterized protein LOC124161533 n=1 Tax=Ischnura elegans TaxID=197161 RepID=UPI001ED88114|nr:uncharacterized protein LOC124161533 [Ischnura elegans]